MLRFKSLPGLIGPLWAALLVVGLPASPANGSIVQGLDLQELVAHADRIVLGRVLFSESFRRADGQLGTWHRIEVEREIRGHAPDEREVIVETLGGQMGESASEAPVHSSSQTASNGVPCSASFAASWPR